MERLIDADILIAELKESALHHCNNPREDSLLQRDRVIVRAQPTVEAIPKADYENRLKADLKAMLTEIQLEIEELEPLCNECDYAIDDCTSKAKVNNIIQQKINELPSVTPQEPKTGHWITKPHIYGVTYCSECDFELKIDNTNYCPNCGAKMVEPQESEG